jgi:hypothetical protein
MARWIELDRLRIENRHVLSVTRSMFVCCRQVQLHIQTLAKLSHRFLLDTRSSRFVYVIVCTRIHTNTVQDIHSSSLISLEPFNMNMNVDSLLFVIRQYTTY